MAWVLPQFLSKFSPDLFHAVFTFLTPLGPVGLGRFAANPGHFLIWLNSFTLPPSTFSLFFFLFCFLCGVWWGQASTMALLVEPSPYFFSCFFSSGGGTGPGLREEASFHPVFCGNSGFHLAIQVVIY